MSFFNPSLWDEFRINLQTLINADPSIQEKSYFVPAATNIIKHHRSLKWALNSNEFVMLPSKVKWSCEKLMYLLENCTLIARILEASFYLSTFYGDERTYYTLDNFWIGLEINQCRRRSTKKKLLPKAILISWFEEGCLFSFVFCAKLQLFFQSSVQIIETIEKSIDNRGEMEEIWPNLHQCAISKQFWTRFACIIFPAVAAYKSFQSTVYF